MAKHTPGPWRAIHTEIVGHFIGAGSPNDQCVVADVLSDDYEADARLIAAAPELLEALQDLMELYRNGQLVIEGEADEGDDPVVGAAFHAIAKAEGRSE